MRRTLLATLTFVTAAVCAPVAGQAGEWQISAYGGFNASSDSDIKVGYGGLTKSYDGIGWDGDSFGKPPYWGVRGTYWLDGAYKDFGLSIDYSHAKVIADLTSPLGDDFSHFEFTDGLNILTLNGLYRVPLNETFTPYVGLGAGINVPHVETTPTATGDFSTAPQTWGFLFGGATLQAQAGLEAKITKSLSVFGEMKYDYSFVNVDLKGGGSLETRIGTGQAIVGLSYKFN
jgi:lipid A oxidase